MNLDVQTFHAGWRCVCPRCMEGEIYKSRFSIDVKEACPVCGLAFAKCDAADGPAVFLIFILGFLLVPLALLLEFSVSPPLWVHVILWGGLTLGLTLGALRPVKAYVLAIQYKHRPDIFE